MIDSTNDTSSTSSTETGAVTRERHEPKREPAREPKREHMPALDASEVAPPLETWVERERRVLAERAAQLAEQRAAAAHEFEARMARARAWKCDNGHGVCVFCAVPLGHDSTGAYTHPDNGCPGPGGSCDECGTPWTWDGKRWRPGCSPEAHDARKRAAAWTLATRGRDPLALPPRVHRNDD
jgi:hypothetical protein